MTTQSHVIERIRALLTDEPVSRELSMFGGRSFMVNEKMIVSALKDGGLLVRVAADRHDELLGEPGAAQAEMGAGRDMGAGWIEVAGPAISDDEALASWLRAALDHNRTATNGVR